MINALLQMMLIDIITCQTSCFANVRVLISVCFEMRCDENERQIHADHLPGFPRWRNPGVVKVR